MSAEAPTRTSLGSALETARAARGQAHQFRHIFDTTLVPMVVLDSDRRLLAANAAARLLSRLSRQEVRSRRIDDLVPSEFHTILHANWPRMMRSEVARGSLDFAFPDGTRLSVNYCALANVLPGQHLIVFIPAGWSDDELGTDFDLEGPVPQGPLSPREREVLTLLATGASFQQIADELTIAVSTVRSHAKNALRKLGARNRVHGIALAMRGGLIDLPSQR